MVPIVRITQLSTTRELRTTDVLLVPYNILATARLVVAVCLVYTMVVVDVILEIELLYRAMPRW
jgi:hypothetical protein